MTTADPYDLSAELAQRTSREDRVKQIARRETEDLSWLMGSKRGRRIVWRLLDRAGVFRLSFNTNAMQMAFAEGCRNEGLRMLAAIQVGCPEDYMVMLKESQDE